MAIELHNVAPQCIACTVIIVLILQPHRIAQLLKLLEELDIMKEKKGQDSGFHLMVI